MSFTRHFGKAEPFRLASGEAARKSNFERLAAKRLNLY